METYWEIEKYGSIPYGARPRFDITDKVERGNEMNETLSDFSAWQEKAKGYFRYVIASKVCYEIIIRYWANGIDLMNAEAELFITGDWHDNEIGADYFDRQLLFRGTVRDCVECATDDYDKSMTEEPTQEK